MKAERITAFALFWIGMGMSGLAGSLVNQQEYGMATSASLSAIGMWFLAGLIIAIEGRTK